jgi:hypothetical protein
MTDTTTWANTWHQHLTRMAEAAGGTLAVAVLELHGPDESSDCRGCDSEGYEAEAPEWGCQTVQLIADMFARRLEVRCPACKRERQALVTGGPIGHHILEDSMWVSCPGSTETVKAFPDRPEAEVMAELTERFTTGMVAAMERIEAASGLLLSPPAASGPTVSYEVAKWEQTMPSSVESPRIYRDGSLADEIMPDANGEYWLPQGSGVAVHDVSALSVGKASD